MAKELYIVGIGPGGPDDMTLRADRILKGADVIVGYTLYVSLVKERYPQAEFFTTPMRKEAERCRLALSKAAEGRTTALVCSGDSGLYGMAGLAMTLAEGFPEVKVTAVPGLTAALAGGALLGAPLSNDTALISLSDLLTPAGEIEEHLMAAAKAGFVICLYNPGSHGRPDALKKACEVLSPYISKDTVCGIARNISREGESVRILSFSELCGTEADMLSLVVVGNSRTRIIGGHMVTPRGYREE